MWSIPFLVKEKNENKVNEIVAFEFSNYVNVVFRYLNDVYGGYFECSECQGMFKRNGDKDVKSQYCSTCKNEVIKEQTRKRVQKYRNNEIV